jgi:hypothetical protein
MAFSCGTASAKGFRQIRDRLHENLLVLLRHAAFSPIDAIETGANRENRGQAGRGVGFRKTVRRSRFGDFTAECEMADSALVCLRFLCFLLSVIEWFRLQAASASERSATKRLACAPGIMKRRKRRAPERGSATRSRLASPRARPD